VNNDFCAGVISVAREAPCTSALANGPFMSCYGLTVRPKVLFGERPRNGRAARLGSSSSVSQSLRKPWAAAMDRSCQS
jgi:hypothetical protein